MDKLAILNDVKKNGYRKVTETINGKNHKQILDSFSASAMLAVHAALRDDLKPKYLAMSWGRMADFAFKQCTTKRS